MEKHWAVKHVQRLTHDENDVDASHDRTIDCGLSEVN
jgi:hypothetical protein